MGSMPESPDQHHIVALEAQYCPIPKFDLSAPYTLTTYSRTKDDEVASRIANATILLVTALPITTAHLSPECTPNLQLIAILASGTDHIDLVTCRKRGIVVCNASQANVPAVSEHTIGQYFACRRMFWQTQQALRDDLWLRDGSCMGPMLDEDGQMPLTCEDEVMGLVGYGVIGQRIAELAQGLWMKILVADRKGALTLRTGRVPFEEVIKKCTVLVIILPRTPDTLNLISGSEMQMMNSSAIIINVARGGILDEDALIAALEKRQIAGAAVDVFKEEPAGMGNSVLLCEKARGLNLITTPHTA